VNFPVPTTDVPLLTAPTFGSVGDKIELRCYGQLGKNSSNLEAHEQVVVQLKTEVTNISMTFIFLTTYMF